MSNVQLFDEGIKQQMDIIGDVALAGIIMKGVLDKFTTEDFKHSYYLISLVDNIHSLRRDGYISTERSVNILNEVFKLYDESIANLVNRATCGGGELE